jgi:hypothetical protein
LYIINEFMPVTELTKTVTNVFTDAPGFWRLPSFFR